MKSSIITYMLWLFAGVWGVHLFYLGRDRHGFVWFITCGGIFGVGWLRDFFRLQDYIDEANENPSYVKYFKSKQMYSKTPPFSSVRFSGELAVGLLFGTLLLSTVPQEYCDDLSFAICLQIASAIAVASGVHLVGCIGQENVSWWKSVVAALIPSLMNIISDPKKVTGNLTSCALFSALAVNYIGKTWKPKEKPRHICVRIFIILTAMSLYSSLWMAAFYHNAYIITNDGHKVKMKVAVENFFNSPAWEDMKDSMGQVFDTFMEKGLWEAIDELRLLIDPEGETNAYRVLGLTSGASQQEITTKYRELVRKWHPDRHKDLAEKAKAEEQFIKIQKAYETISEIHHRRATANSNSNMGG